MGPRLLLLSALCVAACGGKVGDGSDRTNAEILQDEQDGLCSSICDRVVSCGEPGSYEPADIPRCEASCEEVATDAIGGGEPCARITLDALRCYDGLSCAEIGTRNVGDCEDRMDQAARCSGSSRDDSTGTGATVSSPGVGSGDPGSVGSTGACWDGARAPDGAAQVGDMVCEQGCSGTPERTVVCLQGVDSITCECREDGQRVSGFETAECSGDLLGMCPWPVR